MLPAAWYFPCPPPALGIFLPPSASGIFLPPQLATLVTLELNGARAVGVPADALALPSPDLHLTLQRLQAQLGPNMEPLARWIQEPQPLASATQEHATPKLWAEQVDEVRSHLVDTRGTVRDWVRRASQKVPVATAWLSALPRRAAQLRSRMPTVPGVS